jgi:hypothetical protein
MRLIKIFKDEISFETVEDLIAEIRGEEAVDLFFSTSGGMVSAMTILIHALKQHPDVIIHFFDEVNSCVIKLFLEYDGPIILNQDLELISFHAYDRELYGIRYKKSVKKCRVIDTEVCEVLANKLVKEFGISEKKRRQFVDGKDIRFYPKDFKLFTKRKNIKLA